MFEIIWPDVGALGIGLDGSYSAPLRWAFIHALLYWALLMTYMILDF